MRCSMLLGNSADNFHLPRSYAYSAELVLLNMHKISGGGAYLHCYQKLVSPAIQFLLWPTVQWFCFGTFACFAWMCKLTVVDCIVHAATLIYTYYCLLCVLQYISTFLLHFMVDMVFLYSTKWMYISRFGECFHDGQYSLVSFLFAVLLTVPPVPSHL